MKKILFPILATILFITLVGLLTRKFQNQTLSISDNLPSLAKTKIYVGETEIPVEIADTFQKRQKGLSERESLAEREGMLFVFAQKDIQPPFWMKKMKFAIDIIWIDDNKIVQINENVPAPEPDTPNSELKFYSPNQPIDYVLEVNTGFVDENKIKIGDNVNLSGINSE
jgi:uncharacterized membrane protein (UPF0127 family)